MEDGILVTDFLNNDWDVNCIGCCIANGSMEVPGGIIYKTKNFYLHQDPEIPIEGFMIITARKHISSISELDIDEMLELAELVYKARNIVKKIGNINEVTIIQEERSQHLHIWLFPRCSWMENSFENSVASIRDITKYAKEELKKDEQIDKILKLVGLMRKEFNYNRWIKKM